MLDHVSITVSDIAAVERFYDAIMKALEIVKVGRRDDWLGYGERARRLSGARLSHDPQGRNLLSLPCGDLPVGRFVDRAVQPPLQKYFASPSGRNRNRANPSRPTQRGVSRSSRT
jgi:catechol 2,3-dioxygenase-like lactoylglutathione lyase family enzyme